MYYVDIIYPDYRRLSREQLAIMIADAVGNGAITSDEAQTLVTGTYAIHDAGIITLRSGWRKTLGVA